MSHVLVLCEYPTLNGGERSLLSVLPALEAAGFRFTVAAPAAGPLVEALAKRGTQVVSVDFHNRHGERLARPLVRQKLVSLIDQVRPDLVHANSLSMGRLSGPVASESGLPSLAHLRDIVKLSAAAVADLNRHPRLLAVSCATRDYHMAQGLDAHKAQVLYNGVDLKQFQHRRRDGWLHAQLGLPPDALLLGAVGQIIQRKGLDVLVAAAIKLAGRAPPLHWVIVGSRYSQKPEAEQYEAGLHALVSAADLNRHVHFVGTLDAIPELLNEFCLLVHPARQEPLGRVLLEAAASGVACIATEVGGTREIFPPEAHAAVLVPSDDANALAQAVAELAADADRRRQLGLAARRQAEAAFDIAHAARGLGQHYQDVIEACRSGFPA